MIRLYLIDISKQDSIEQVNDWQSLVSKQQDYKNEKPKDKQTKPFTSPIVSDIWKQLKRTPRPIMHIVMNSSVPFTKQTLNKSWSNKQVDPEENIEEMEIINPEEAIDDHEMVSAITEEETVDHAVLFLDRAPSPTEWSTQTTTTILNKPIKPTTAPQTTNK
ncbi:hypothetical protein G6F37_012257 [Rhizopus arrhizus]|nr:hypothetical protein G6F38_012294 [Rhizopus arrhizus]KAG1144699.1 hypothetical protein G6F37_012257 [Rhizopus arrhizus]